jgi:general secretion pathway protein D
MIREVVEALDVPLEQVVIEATILEVTLTDDLEYGVQFFLEENGITLRSGLGPGSPTDSGGSGAVALATFVAFTGVNIDVLVSALQDVTDINVISSPYLAVIDGEPARLFVGDEIPLEIASQESTDDGTVTVTTEIERRDTGIIVEVTPVIRPDASVRLLVNTEVSTALPATEGNELTTTIQQRSVNSDLVVSSGQTVLLGGLIQDRLALTDRGVPVLKNVPVLGSLFGVKGSDVQRTELLVLLTPRVIRTGGEIDRVTRLVERLAAQN